MCAGLTPRVASPAELPRRLRALLRGSGEIVIAASPAGSALDLAPDPSLPGPKPAGPGRQRGRAGSVSLPGSAPPAAALDGLPALSLDPETAGQLQAWAGADGAVIVPTSGSTGCPRQVILPVAALRAAAAAAHERLGGPGSWTTALPTHHVAGLMTIVRACLAGRPWRQTAGDLAGLRRPAGDGPHYLSLVPTQLYRALAQPATAAVLAAFDAVLVGGASLDPALRDAALGQGLRVIRTYGMSETAGGVVYDGEPLPGLSVSLRPWPGAGTGGRIAITGPTCFAGYLGQPAASAAVLSPAAAPPAVLDGAFEREAGLSSPDGLSGQPGQPPAAGAVPAAGVSAPAAVCRTFLTSDLGFWDGSRLQVTGRIDDVVQSGGADVDLAALQRQLDAVFGSSQVVAFAVPDLVWGSRIMAATAGPVTADDVADRLGGRIAAAARPRAVIRVEAMPLTSSGKADRRALATLWEEFARGDNR